MPFYKPTLDRILMNQGETAHKRACRRLLDLRTAFKGEYQVDGVEPEELAISERVDGHLLLATSGTSGSSTTQATDGGMTKR